MKFHCLLIQADQVLKPLLQVEGKVPGLTIALSLLAVAIVVLLLAALIFWWVKRKKTKEKVPLEVANLSISGTLGSAYGHIRTFPESQSLLSSRKSSTMTNQQVERAEEHMDGRVSRFIDDLASADEVLPSEHLPRGS